MNHVLHPDKKLEFFINFLLQKQLAAAMKKFTFSQTASSRLSDLDPHLFCFSCFAGVAGHHRLHFATFWLIS